MFRTMTSVCALTLACAPAFAQELTYGAFGVNYSEISDDGTDFSSTRFDGDIEYSFGQVLLGAKFEIQNLDTF